MSGAGEYSLAYTAGWVSDATPVPYRSRVSMAREDRAAERQAAEAEAQRRDRIEAEAAMARAAGEPYGTTLGELFGRVLARDRYEDHMRQARGLDYDPAARRFVPMERGGFEVTDLAPERRPDASCHHNDPVLARAAEISGDEFMRAQRAAYHDRLTARARRELDGLARLNWRQGEAVR